MLAETDGFLSIQTLPDLIKYMRVSCEFFLTAEKARWRAERDTGAVDWRGLC